MCSTDEGFSRLLFEEEEEEASGKGDSDSERGTNETQEKFLD